MMPAWCRGFSSRSAPAGWLPRRRRAHAPPSLPPPPPLHPAKQAVFKHPGDAEFRLRVPEFSVKPGELVAVVGRVGAGKSSLLQAILGNMDLVGARAWGLGLPRQRAGGLALWRLWPGKKKKKLPSSSSPGRRSPPLPPQCEGVAHAAGDMSYVPQTAWCQNISL